MIMNAFHDAHLHVLGIGYSASIVDLSNASSIKEVQKILKEALKEDKEILLARGWDQSVFKEQRMIEKEDLNKVSKEKPIVAIRTCGHIISVNDPALDLAHIRDARPQVDGGSFDLDTGIFTEQAINLIYDALPPYSKEDIKGFLKVANDLLLSKGVTTVYSDDFSMLNVDFEVILEAMQEAYEEGSLRVRITEQVNLPKRADLKRFIDQGYANKLIHKNFKMGPLKLLADGSLGGHTAYMNEPYSDLDTVGIKTFKDDELVELLKIADEADMDAHIHAIGDGTIDQLLWAFEKVMKESARHNHEYAIIHTQLANIRQIKKMKELGITTIVQPIFLNSDIPIIASRIGERAEESYLFYTMFKEGIPTLFSTDAPVEAVDPFLNLYTALTRKSLKHHNLGPFLIDEAFSLEEAIGCYQNPAGHFKDVFMQDRIEVDKNIYEIDKEEMKDVKVLRTYMDSELVYRHDE